MYNDKTWFTNKFKMNTTYTVSSLNIRIFQNMAVKLKLAKY